MRSKAPLAMLEQLVMLLVFALAAALCLQAFVLSDQNSKQNSRRDAAVVEVQRVAETVKHCAGDPEQIAQLLEGSWDGETLTVPCAGGTVTVTPDESGHALLGMAQVRMTDDRGEELFSVPVSWQTGENQ